MNYKYTADIMDDVLFRAGEPTDSAGSRSSDFAVAALRYINRAYQAVWMGGTELNPLINEDWHWLKKETPGVLSLLPVIDVGTIAVTNNNNSITFSSAPINSLTGCLFKVDGFADVFRISAHTGGSALATLDGIYTGATNSASAYKAMTVIYSLASDLLKVFSPMRVYQDNQIKIIGISTNEMDSAYPLTDLQGGVPTRFAIIGDLSGVRRIRFNKYGDVDANEYIRVDYDYLYTPADLTDSDSEEPVIPFKHRRILADLALYFILMDKNDRRASAVGNLAKTILEAMMQENRSILGKVSDRFGKILPRASTLRVEGPLRTESGLIITG